MENIRPYAPYIQESTDVLPQSFQETTQTLFRQEESGESHNSYDAERREMHCIETGDVEQLLTCWREERAENVGTLSRDTFRNTKYLCVINIALSSRAAVRGGLPYELAYALCDTYCQQIDNLEEAQLPQIEEIVRSFQLSYAQLVHQQKNNAAKSSAEEPPIISRAKNYIFSHLHGRLSVNELAEVLSIHPNYLSRVFKQTTGSTLHDYILHEKIKLVCTMLTFSDYSYIDIANYFGFSSQSHLGKSFKHVTGMTLKQYRNTYHKF